MKLKQLELYGVFASCDRFLTNLQASSRKKGSFALSHTQNLTLITYCRQQIGHMFQWPALLLTTEMMPSMSKS